MSTAFGECLGIVAPYYNLVLVMILLLLFLKLFSIKNKKRYLLPWQLLFLAVVIYIIEEMLTVFFGAAIIQLPRIVNVWLEFGIITLFIYLLLKQKEFLEKSK